MSRNLQYARTDRDITEAFLKLLQEKSFEKITVGDIIAEAMVNRSTFYQHYPDKFAVLEALQKRYLEELISQLRTVDAQSMLDLGKLDGLMAGFYLRNRQALRALLKVKTESFDLREQWQELIIGSLGKEMGLSPLEAEMMASMAVSFFVHCMEHEEAAQSFSSLFFESMLHISLGFFGLGNKPEAREAFLFILGKYAQTTNEA